MCKFGAVGLKVCLCAGEAFGLGSQDEDLSCCELEVAHVLADQLHEVAVDSLILGVALYLFPQKLALHLPEAFPPTPCLSTRRTHTLRGRRLSLAFHLGLECHLLLNRLLMLLLGVFTLHDCLGNNRELPDFLVLTVLFFLVLVLLGTWVEEG